MSDNIWGEQTTKFFFELTPDVILDSVELAFDVRSTGRAIALNSMENRVYDVELEEPFCDEAGVEHKSLIIKFYRPGRWSEAQILDEHEFLIALATQDIPVIAPLRLDNGDSLFTDEKTNLFFTVFPKVLGRSPDELTIDQTKQIGRMLARIHNVGSMKPARHRLSLNTKIFGSDNLAYLMSSQVIPVELRDAYCQIVSDICTYAEPLFAKCKPIRIHGDCHRGNILQGRSGLFAVDFDDMLNGPAVQDMWLLIPSRDAEGQERFEILLEAYESMRAFDRSELKLVEVLRALRFIHFASWMAKRWSDPSFPRAFPYFGTQKYWQDQLKDLREQWAMINF